MNNNNPTFQLPNDPQTSPSGNNEAADLIRAKVDRAFGQEPDVVSEAIESAQEEPKKRSKHQKFMMDLASSGKPFAMIQMEWHDYYNQLPDHEKHEVWEEFYSAQSHKPVIATHNTTEPTVQPVIETPAAAGSFEPMPAKIPRTDRLKNVAEAKQQIIQRVQGRGKLNRTQHIKSMLFGLSVGGVMLLVLMFGFFNERIIAPFITPSRNVSSTPIISDPTGTAVGTEPKLIIPKINVEVPVVYDVETVDEAAVQEGLERGVVHYATTSNPGEVGNSAIFGHSSNNLLNRGKYKFAFVLLSRLENDDTFYIEKDGKRYVYKIFDKRIVSPDEVSVLNDVPGKTSTMALITCDPPGTTINRLVVWGEQISPDPAGNVASTAIKTDAETSTLAGNAPSLWSRIWTSIF